MRIGRNAHEQLSEMYKLVRWLETRDVGETTLLVWLERIGELCDEVESIAAKESGEDDET